MTDFRINVIIDPRQVPKSRREVERELGLIEQRANRVQSALGRAFAGFSLAFAIREVTRYADAFTNLQNRLRFLVPEQQALVRTTEDLLRVANETRSSFEGTVILYQRLGLATRELGISSDNLLGIVRSINQALILSGASAKEANNGLIQLSQGIAANRLGGDELRSTLEQLPVVADVIARELGVTRGELRELGAQGAITGEVIVNAFQNAAEELDQQFGQTVPTLAQSFTVLQNSLTVFIGTLNTSSGALAALGAIIRVIANNLDLIAKSLVVTGAAFAALQIAPVVQAFFELQRAAKAGELVILGSAEAARQKAEFDRQQAQAALTAAGAEVQKTRETLSSIAVERQSTLVTEQGTAASVRKAEAELQAAAASQRSAEAALRALQAEQSRAVSTSGLVERQEALAAAEARLAQVRQAGIQTTVIEQASLAGLQRSYDQLGLAFERQTTSVIALEAAEARLTAAETRLQTVTQSGTVKQIESATANLEKAKTNAELALSNNIAADSEVARLISLIERTEAEAASSLVSKDSTAQALRQAEANRAAAASNLQQAQASVAAAASESQVAAARKLVEEATEDLTRAQAQLTAAQAASNQQVVLLNATQAREAGIKQNLRVQTEALAAAEARLAAATAAANTQANIFTRTLARVRAGVAALTATIAANPIGALLVGITAIVTALVVFRDRLRLAGDGIATLGDFIAEFIDSTKAAFSQLIAIFDSIFGGLISRVVDFVGQFQISFRSIIESAAAVADTLIGIVAGIAAGIGSIILDIPGIFARGFELAVNAVITVLELIPDTLVALVRTVGETFDIFFNGLIRSFELSSEAIKQAFAGNFDAARQAGLEAAEVLTNALERSASPGAFATRFAKNFGEEFEDELIPRLEVTPTTFRDIGSRAAAAFSAGFNADVVSGFVQDLFVGAELRAEQRQAAEFAKQEAEARQAAAEAAAAQAVEVGLLIRNLRDEQTFLRESITLGQRQAEVNREILDINRQLASKDLSALTPDQEQDVRSILNINAALEAQQGILQRVSPINNEFNNTIADLQFLLSQGAISLRTYNAALAELEIEAARAGTSVSDGIKVGLNDSLAALFDFSSTTQEIIRTTFDEIQNVIALTFEGAVEFIDEFIRNGEVSFAAFRDFLLNIFADALEAIGQQFLQLAAQQATAGIAEGLGFEAVNTAQDQIDVGAQQALLAQRQTIVGQEQTAAATLQTAAGTLGTGAGTLATGAGTLGKSVSLLSGANTGLSTGAATLKTAATTLAGAIPGLQTAAATLLSAAKLQATAGIAGGAAGIPAAASGTPAALAGQPILVGEEGPELFTPGQTGAIVPNDQTIGALAEATSNQGQTVVVQQPPTPMNVTVVNVTDPNEVATALSTPGGEQAILNVLSKNRNALQEFTAN